MKINYLILSLILILFTFKNTQGQNCHEFHKSTHCAIENADDVKLSSLSRSHYLEVGKTVTYEVVLYGQKEVIIQCCTEEKYYPLRFKLKSSINGELIYDNKIDDYRNSINLELDRTELISIEITIADSDERKNKLQGTKACIGMAIYMEKTAIRQ